MAPIIGVIIGAVVASAIESAIVAAIVGSLVAGLVTSVLSGRPKQNKTGATQASGRSVTIRSPAAPWQIVYGQCRVGGVLTYVEESTDKQYLYLIFTFTGHPIEEFTSVYFNDEIVSFDLAGTGAVTGSPTSRYESFAWCWQSLGDEGGAQPFPTLQGESNDLWTSAHLQRDCAKLCCKLKADPEVWPGGVPNVTAVIKGAKVYDTRTATSAWSDNPVLCIGDYLTNTKYGMGLAYSELDTTSFEDAADACEVQVEIQSDPSVNYENRYRANGAFDTGTAPKAILENLLAAMAGWAVNVGGSWHVHAGAYEAATVTLDENDFAGPVTVQTNTSRRDNCNSVRGTFVDPNNQWQPQDFPALVSSAYIAEDNNEQVWKDIDLTSFVISSSQAQRLSKIELFRSRQGLTATIPCKLSAFRALTGHTVAVDYDKMGWSAKEFEVNGTQFAVNNDGTLGVTLTLRETASEIYDWTVSEEQTQDFAPNTNLPDPFSVPMPGAPSVEEDVYETRDGRGLAIKAVVTSTTSDASVTLFQFSYRAQGASSWILLSPTFASALSATSEIYDLARGFWEFRARTQNSLGIKSSWSTTTTKELTGLGTAPAAPTITGVQLSMGAALISISEHPERDVLVGGRIIVRHTEAFVDPAWNETFSIGDPDGYPGSSTILILPLKPGSYMLKAEDSTGLQSTTASVINTKQSFLFQLNSVDDITEDPTFPGVHTNTVVVSTSLQLGENSGDDLVYTSGTYEFDGAFDFGAVTRVRVTGEIQGTGVAAFDTVDSRTELIDSWPDFDGAIAGGIVDCWIEARETDDDVATGGSPETSWSEWKRCDSGDFECWGMEFRAQLSTNDGAYNVVVDTLRVHAEEIP